MECNSGVIVMITTIENERENKMDFAKNERVVKRQSRIEGTVTDPNPRNLYTGYGYKPCIGVQWDSGFGSNFGPQWTPIHIIEKTTNN